MADPRPAPRSVQRVFWRLIREGVSTGDAAGRVGISVRQGFNWFGKAGGMPPLSLVEPVRSRALSISERESPTALPARSS